MKHTTEDSLSERGSELKRLGTYRLREYARSVGVKAPTSKRINQLIAEIIEIEKTGVKRINATRGRPPIPCDISSEKISAEEYFLLANENLRLAQGIIELNNQLADGITKLYMQIKSLSKSKTQEKSVKV